MTEWQTTTATYIYQLLDCYLLFYKLRYWLEGWVTRSKLEVQIILIFNLKQWLSMLNGKLCDDSNSSKTSRVMSNGMPETRVKALPLLKALVDCFMSRSNSLLHSLVIFFSVEWTSYLHILWSIPTIPEVSFNSLVCVKLVDQSQPKDLDVRVKAAW